MDYPNNKNIERIWAYLDGGLDEEAKQAFEQELIDNKALAQNLKSQKALQHSLYNLELEKAPDAIAVTVMKQISAHALTTKATSFKKIKYLGLGFGILNLAFLVVAIVDIKSGVAVGMTLEKYTTISDQFSKMTSLLNRLEWSIPYKFMLGAALLLLMYSLDQIISMSRMKKAKI